MYPFFGHEQTRSDFRFPPLGLGYLASSLLAKGIRVKIVDGTFTDFRTTIDRVSKLSPRIVGIYSMITMEINTYSIARRLRDDVDFLVAGGPLPSLIPDSFLDTFDAVVMGEGEIVFPDLVGRYLAGMEWNHVSGIAYRNERKQIVKTSQTNMVDNLDIIPTPARDLFQNQSYIKYWTRYFGYSATNQMTTRGCPFSCDFCSSPVFGKSYREVSSERVVDEMLEIQKLGYDRVFFSDDCFTLNMNRVSDICSRLKNLDEKIEWMCLSRVDRLDDNLARQMAEAGCVRILFGIESGNDRMLKVMKKETDLHKVRKAVRVASEHGIETGGFFILGYPGETAESLLDTINLSSSLGLDFVSYSYPYPIPGTGLYEKAKHHQKMKNPKPRFNSRQKYRIRIDTGISQRKLDFARIKGQTQQRLNQNGPIGKSTAHVFERITDEVFRFIR
ncbi:MAG: B12-binding domain-containing radical SAM protein [Candidatus Thorarchaeota archaeon]